MLTRFIPPFRSEIPPQSEKVAAQSALFPIVAKGAVVAQDTDRRSILGWRDAEPDGKADEFSLRFGYCPQLFANASGTSATKGCHAAPALKGNAHLQQAERA
jgi:hypothetical protein